MIRDAVVPMDICVPVDGEPLVLRKLFAPALLIAVNGPVVAVEAAPKDSPAVPVE